MAGKDITSERVLPLPGTSSSLDRLDMTVPKGDRVPLTRLYAKTEFGRRQRRFRLSHGARDLNFGYAVSMSENTVAISSHSKPFWCTTDGPTVTVTRHTCIAPSKPLILPLCHRTVWIVTDHVRSGQAHRSASKLPEPLQSGDVDAVSVGDRCFCYAPHSQRAGATDSRIGSRTAKNGELFYS